MTRAALLLELIGEALPDAPSQTRLQRLRKSPTAKFVGRTARLSLHKYLPKKHQRAGKIARYGAVGLVATAPVVGHVSATAGTVAGMHKGDREALKHSVHHLVTDPESRHAIVKGAKDYVTSPDTLHAIGKDLRGKVSRALLPIQHFLPKKNDAAGEEKTSHEGQKVWKQVRAATPVNTPLHRISYAAENDRILNAVANQGSKAIRHKIFHPSSDTEKNASSDGIHGYVERAKRMAGTLKKVKNLPILQQDHPDNT